MPRILPYAISHPMKGENEERSVSIDIPVITLVLYHMSYVIVNIIM